MAAPPAPGRAARRRCATGRSSTSLPSRKTTIRLAYSAMSASCVIRTTVLPSSLSFWKTRHDLLGGLRVEVAGRLVGEDELGLVDERARDRHALLLSAGELARLVVLPARQAHDGEAPPRLLLALPRRVTAVRVDQRQLDVLERRRAREQVEGLEDEADLPVADLRPLVAVELRDVHAVEKVAARGRPVEAADDVHERALAGARRAHDGHELARRDRERDAVERAHLDLAHLVDLDEVLDPDDIQAQNLRPPRAAGRGARRPAAASAFAVARPTTTVSPALSSPETICVKRPSVIPARISTGFGSPAPLGADRVDGLAGLAAALPPAVRSNCFRPPPGPFSPAAPARRAPPARSPRRSRLLLGPPAQRGVGNAQRRP